MPRFGVWRWRDRMLKIIGTNAAVLSKTPRKVSSLAPPYQFFSVFQAHFWSRFDQNLVPMAKVDCIFHHFRFGRRFCISFYSTWWVSDRSGVSLSASWSTFDRKTHMFCRHFLVQVDSLVCSMSGRFWAPNLCFCIAFCNPLWTYENMSHLRIVVFVCACARHVFPTTSFWIPFPFRTHPRLIKSDAKQSSAKQCGAMQSQAIHGTNQCELQRKAMQS